jgi:hypothetical protein
MGEREFLFNPVVWFWAPLGLALVCVIPIWVARNRRLVASLRFLSLGLITLSILATAFWCWYFKDGLGPGLIPSTGWTALRRFLAAFSIPLAIAATEGLLISWLFRRRLLALREPLATTETDRPSQ